MSVHPLFAEALQPFRPHRHNPNDLRCESCGAQSDRAGSYSGPCDYEGMRTALDGVGSDEAILWNARQL